MTKATLERKNWHQTHVKRVTDMLFDMHAVHLSSQTRPNAGTLDFYACNGKVVIVQQYANEAGMEVWCPITASMKMDDVVEATKAYICSAKEVPR